jgi:hypothetical protein
MLGLFSPFVFMIVMGLGTTVAFFFLRRTPIIVIAVLVWLGVSLYAQHFPQ